MRLFIHQTHHTIADFKGILSYIKSQCNNNNQGLHLFPELFLTGYPLQDLCLHKTFIKAYHQLLETLDNWSLSSSFAKSTSTLLLGGLKYSMGEDGLPYKIENVIYQLIPGEKLKVIYTKKLLPNYDIFDEKKYFTPGNKVSIYNYQGLNLALMICEDMWPSTFHQINPVADIQNHIEKNNIKLDLVINLSASPFHLGKKEKRIARGMEISNLVNAPFIYINRVGGEDEILFDGASFAVTGNKLIKQTDAFSPCIVQLSANELFGNKDQKTSSNKNKQKEIKNTWESLFNPSLDKSKVPPKVKELENGDCLQILEALKFGIQEYANKSGFKNFLVALSGGIDSSLVVTIAHLALKKDQNIEAIFMPGLYSSPLSYDLSFQLAKKLGIKLHNLPIKFLHSTVRNTYKDTFNTTMSGLTDENIQSRLRGSLLYARSNQTNAMVLNTSNKSELAVGYSTIYGDSVGALSVLGDLYKTEILRLSKFINYKYDNIIPAQIIERPPTAELRENQEDSDSLPPYEILDAILEGILSYRMDLSDLIDCGFKKEEVKKVYDLYQISEYKRSQFCPIIKLKAKSFGFGYRVPICKENSGTINI